MKKRDFFLLVKFQFIHVEEMKIENHHLGNTMVLIIAGKTPQLMPKSVGKKYDKKEIFD